MPATEAGQQPPCRACGLTGWDCIEFHMRAAAQAMDTSTKALEVAAAAIDKASDRFRRSERWTVVAVVALVVVAAATVARSFFR